MARRPAKPGQPFPAVCLSRFRPGERLRYTDHKTTVIKPTGRVSDPEKTQNWKDQFQRSPEYCAGQSHFLTLLSVIFRWFRRLSRRNYHEDIAKPGKCQMQKWLR